MLKAECLRLNWAVVLISAFSLSNSAFGFELKVLTFNLATIPFLQPRATARTARVAELIRRDGYDVAGFQECWYSNCVANLAAAFPNTVRLRDGIVGGDGLLIGSRLPILDREIFTYSINAPLHRFIYGEADGIASKGVIVATLKTPEGPLIVFDTHLLAGYPGRNYVPERVGQLYELACFIRAYAEDRPYLLFGDLNLNPKSAEYPILVGLLGLRDACPDCSATDQNGRIDHIFLGPSMAGWTVTRGAVVMTETLDAAGRIPLSDHKALTAVLRSPAHGKGNFTLTSLTPGQGRVLNIGLDRRRALLGVITGLERFISDTDHSLNINLIIPFYGWSHARWALRQIAAARRIQALALNELTELTKK
jgi:endonuclease/exonuclease/phosphatase family metal-dependent hydrolase